MRDTHVFPAWLPIEIARRIDAAEFEAISESACRELEAEADALGVYLVPYRPERHVSLGGRKLCACIQSDVCLPSPALARLIDPSAIASDDLTAKELLRRTRKSLKQALMEAGVEVAATSRSPIWQVVARLEQHSDSSIRGALEKSIAYNGEDITERFAEHVDTFADWMDDQGSLRISEERLTHLARIAAFSPAISLLRAFWTTFPDSSGEVHEKLVDLCFGELRSYFNRRTVRAIVERIQLSGRSRTQPPWS